ncbi:hypothetical protein P7C71_g2030, partial [Lecanoromycetidae sp. Uapishka_2]
MAGVVFSGVAENTDLQGKLFQDIKFWLSHKVPQRAKFVNDVNGGEVVPLEKQADVIIVDHVRKELPPGSHSYQFIEKSVRNGVLEDLNDHKAGPPPGQTRSIGSIIQPPKGTRQKFTLEDDRILWNWVQKTPQKLGGTRVPHNAPPTPPSDVPAVVKRPVEPKAATAGADVDPFDSFTEADADALLAVGEDILNIHQDNTVAAWKKWSKDFDKDKAHTPQQWQAFWEEYDAHQSPSKEAARTTSQEALRATEEVTEVDGPSYHPGTPTMQLTGRVLLQEASKPPSEAAVQIPASQAARAAREIVQAEEEERFPPKRTVKRKHVALVEEIPSSSPPQPSFSPKRQRQSTVERPLEIASTPEGSPSNRRRRQPSPLVPDIEGQADDYAHKFENDFEENESPFGQQLSDTLSEPPNQIDDTQAMFREPSQPLDLDIPPPEEGWDKLENDDNWDYAERHISNAEEAGNLISGEDEELGELLPDEAETFRHLVPEEAEKPEHNGMWEDGTLEIPETGQHIFQIPNQHDELGDDENLGADASGTETEPSIIETHDRKIIIQETQAILRAQTEPPDFSIAEPDGGWENLIPSSPPLMPGSPQAESEGSSVTDDQLDVWIKEQVQEGVTEEQAGWVLKCTSMDTELAEEVVKYLAMNGEIPQRRRGVWTELDDENLHSTDARKIQRLEDKHGKDELKTRWEFLQKWSES